MHVSERRACAALGQRRSTKRKIPRGREDETRSRPICKIANAASHLIAGAGVCVFLERLVLAYAKQHPAEHRGFSPRLRSPSTARQHADPPHPLSLLRPRCQRPRHRRATEQRDELSPSHSITSSARGEQHGGHLDAEPFRGLEVDHQEDASGINAVRLFRQLVKSHECQQRTYLSFSSSWS